MESRVANKKLVESLYAALAAGDTAAAGALLAADVCWWFHGPRRCQHMRRRLTGEAGVADFVFAPKRVAAVGNDGRWVVAEGWEGDQAYWVHAWAVEGGLITRFREYFNTSVTVQEVAGDDGSVACGARAAGHAVWQSQGCGHVGRSLPGLVLAI